MSKKLVQIVVAIILLVGVYFYASPYLVLHNLKNAVEKGDSAKISSYVDYVSVRQNFKEQLNAYVAKEMKSRAQEMQGLEALGAMMATAMVDKAVDTLLTEQSLTLMLKGKNLNSVQTNEKPVHQTAETSTNKPEYNTRYVSMNRFELTIQGKQPNETVKVMMDREGMSWKIKQIIVPLE